MSVCYAGKKWRHFMMTKKFTAEQNKLEQLHQEKGEEREREKERDQVFSSFVRL